MNERVNILQFSPYFPPHKWGLETVVEEIAEYWVKKWYWDVINITFYVWQEKSFDYSQKSYKVYLLPSFDIIPNFPFPKLWKKEFWEVFKELNQYILSNDNIRVFSHTRFFISSLIAWIFARKHNVKWVHIEHGSDYVKLSSKIKSKISYIYDKIIWKWIFKKADKVLAISKACKKFITEEFIERKIEVFYRGIELLDTKKIEKPEINLVYIGRLVNLKWVDILLKAFTKSKIKNQLFIIWDGEEKWSLLALAEKLWINKRVKFLWFKDRDFIVDFLSNNNLVLVNPSYQEGLPTTVIEWLSMWCPVIATNVWWTNEISNKEDLILIEKWNIFQLSEKIQYSFKEYEKLSWLSLESIHQQFNRENNIRHLYDNIK